MDRIEKSSADTDESFLKYVFKFDDPEKGTILNIIQYTVLSIIPLIIILKLIKHYIPEADEDKGSLVIFTEVIGQLLIMFISLYFINRIIMYIPTYSGIAYSEVNLLNVILAILMISLTINTKLGEKVQILLDRLYDMYEGQTSSKKDDKKSQQGGQGQVRVTQPLSQQYIPTTAPGQIPEQLQSMQTNNKSQTNEYSMGQQASPSFNNMYGGPTTPLVGAATPTMEPMEPMAANDALGGAFGSLF
jgi:hypothetical protein